MKKILFCLCLFAVFFLSAQETYEAGTIIDSIPIANKKDENFSLYLPESFRYDELNSIVFIFEPMGRATLGIEVFREAAETYGHILVCSNAIRNGSYQRNFEMTERLINHVFSEFNINENQIYLAGFSGGSRLASAIATLTNIATGVIACGAGFTASHTPSTQKFDYVGICGNKDMNFMEMMSVHRYLENIKFNNTLFTFDGNHRWPPQDEILKAFDWLSIEAHKRGLIKKSKKELHTSYVTNLKLAKKTETSKNPLRAIEEYERVLSTYKTFYTLDSVATKIDALKKRKANIRAEKSRKIAFEKENKYTELAVSRFNEDFSNAKKVNVSWWKKQLTKIDKERDSADSEIDNMVERLRYKIYAMAYEKMIFTNPKATAEQVAFCKEVCKLIYPKFQ